mgnify:CR=1 FL=1
MGLPLEFHGKLYNTAAVLSGGEILGIVPKQYLPNYGEFYEAVILSPEERFWTISYGKGKSSLRQQAAFYL